jgi:hypothetical protein
MSKIQTIIWLFIFVVIICSMNVFFGITESFGGRGGGVGGGLGRGLGVGSGLGVTMQNTNGGYFIPRLRLLQEDN